VYHWSEILTHLLIVLQHALGFNALSLAHFRRLDGSPITPRVDGEIPVTEVECTGPHTGRSYANVTLPSPEILQFRSVRGGVRVAEIVTPNVAQVVRNHFDCQSLPGAELESGEFLPLSSDPEGTSCIGDHLERRLFRNDLMNPVVDDLEFNPKLSTLDLAYFADSGWYQVDLSRAAHASGWGRAAGCDFVEEPCINEDGQVPPSFADSFCDRSPEMDTGGYANTIDGCTPDLSKKAACSLDVYKGELPNEYQYFHFTLGSNIGGSDPFMDYCPTYSGFSNGLCSDPDNERLIRVDPIERFGERNSRCVAGEVTTGKTALCLRIACVVEDRSFHVQVDGQWQRCSYKGEVLLSDIGDKVICPDPIRICPTFYCKRDCLGSPKKCDYSAGMCVCNDASCHGADEATTFVDSTIDGGLPDEESPLADYYVPTARSLRNERRTFGLLTLQQLVTIALTIIIVLAAIVAFLWRRRRQATTTNNDDLPDVGTPVHDIGQVNPNKDKMIASVVVDMRIRDPNLRQDPSVIRDILADRASETDLSMTDTDAGMSHVSNLSVELESSPFELNNVEEEYIDPLAPPTSVRRRNVHDAR